MQQTAGLKKIKVLVVGDTHGDDQTPEKRKDNYAQACLEELQEIVEIANDKNCDLVLHLGDVFHRIEPGPFIRNGYLKILLQSKIPWYTLIGNHDVRHNLDQYYDTSSIRTLIEAGALRIDDSIHDYGIYLMHHTATKAEECAEGFLLDKEFPIIAAHISITLAPYFGSYILFDDLPTNSKTKIVVCGHIHDAMEKTRQDGVQFMNPGSVCRKSLNEANITKEPKVLFLEYDLSGELYQKEYIKLKSSKPAEEIFKLDEALAAKDQKHDAQKYIKQISMMSLVDSEDDIFESLKKSAKLKNIDENVAEHAIKTLKALSDN
jgi:DNA repair exonuclease SbcCD nuclease subunit